MNAYKLLTIIVVSVLVAILLASALNGFTRVADSALADIVPTATPLGNAPSSITPAKRDYLPVIFLNSATAGGAWLLAGNAGTNPASDFLGTTDNVTLTFRVSNAVSWRLAPAGTLANPKTANVIGGYGGNSVAPGVFGATIGGGGGSIDASGSPCPNNCSNSVNATYATIGGGISNTIPVTGNYAFISGGGFNTASGAYATIGGGTHNTASNSYVTIGGGQFNTAGGVDTTIGGGDTNIATGYQSTISGGAGNNSGGDSAFIGGGFGNTIPVTGTFSTVGGGYLNTASGVGAFVGGGGTDGFNFFGNVASGDASTIGGGLLNIASGKYSIVGGGFQNTASGGATTTGGGLGNTIPVTGAYAFIGGGYANSASGLYASVPGGFSNVAQGNSSFAAGYRAQANHKGAFVWADSTNADFASTGNDQFLIRANGGVGIGTNNPIATLYISSTLNTGGDNTATFSNATLGPHLSHIHFGAKGDWYIRSAADNGKVVIQDIPGSVGIGTSSPSASYKLDVNGKIRATGYYGTCRTDGVTAGGPFCNQDFAETFQSVERTAPGDLVALVTSAKGAPTVRKSSNAYDELLIGVVSQNPGLVFGNGQTHLAGDNSQLITNDKTVVALVGRVQVKVSVENGAINVGDPLTSSSTPGVAMKATQAGKIIGYAMESANADGKILVLVQPGDYVPPAQLDALKQNAQLEARLSAVEQSQNLFTLNNVPLWGIIGLLALLLVRRRK